MTTAAAGTRTREGAGRVEKPWVASSTRTMGTRVAGPRGAQDAPGLLVLGRYRLHRPLGAGGFGTVWQASDERLDRDVAVKVLPRERIISGRFEREARAAARLSHPAIVTLYEAAVDDEGAYLVSELVRGRTLSQLLEAGRLSDHDIVQIGIALADALSHAHQHGVVHRDVKPSNVLVPDRPGSPSEVAKLTDFGVARLVGGDTLTRTGDVVGTAAYMSPEQAEGREAAPPADLYSLALVLYEALTGVNPIAAGTPAQRARRLGAHLPPLRRQRRDLPLELGRGIDLALRPRPRERGTVEELREELRSSLDQVEDRPGVVESPWPRGSARRPQPADGFAPPAPGPAAAANTIAPSTSLVPGRTARGPVRMLAGLAAAVVAAWVDAKLLAPSPLAPAVAALLACLLVAGLPRIGWLALTAVLGGMLVAQGHAGAGALVLVAALVPLALMPRARTAWPLASLAPVLGAVGLAGAWPALAARAPSAWQRAALAAAGWIWTLVAGVLTGKALYTTVPAGVPPGHTWMASLGTTADHVLPSLVTPPLLAPALLWGLAAAVLPWLTRGRAALQVALVTVWSATLAAGTASALRAAYPNARLAPGLVVLGATVGALIALAPVALTRLGLTRRSSTTSAGLA
jgi:eukaryotic-like serine/threonine-protein kinase